MSKEDFSSVLSVHLHGTFAVTHAAWKVMTEKKFGRIINIGSGNK